LFLVGFISGELAATVMAGYEGHRGWLNYLAVAPASAARALAGKWRRKPKPACGRWAARRSTSRSAPTTPR
jgi:hypothetical protein